MSPLHHVKVIAPSLGVQWFYYGYNKHVKFQKGQQVNILDTSFCSTLLEWNTVTNPTHEQDG